MNGLQKESLCVCVCACAYVRQREREGERKRVESAAEGQRTSPSQKTRILQENIVSQISNDNSINQDHAQSDKNRNGLKFILDWLNFNFC